MIMSSECKATAARRSVATGWRRPCARLAVLALGLALAPAPAVAGDGLTGRIWVPDEARFTTPAEVDSAVGRADFVLLGETHTVARHHALQARFVRAAAHERRPAVVFEMIPADGQADIDRWRTGGAPDPAGFGPAVGWGERGWPAWSHYEPIVRAALDRELALRAGAPARDVLETVARQGLAAAGEAARGLPGLDDALTASGRGRLLDTLRRVHCGIPEHAPVDRMIAVQRLRDAAMARAMLAADDATGDGAVLIAGHGHTRGDYGVPVYLERAAPQRSVVSIAFFGTIGAPTIAAQRAAAGGKLPFDYVWFTEGGEPAPDCAAETRGGEG